MFNTFKVYIYDEMVILPFCVHIFNLQSLSIYFNYSLWFTTVLVSQNAF